jgi:hypothetical protein
VWEAPSQRSRRRFDRPFAEIIDERRLGPPRAPEDAAAPFVFELARALLRREARPDRADRVVADFVEAAVTLTHAASSGATLEEQAELLHKFWRESGLPEADFRKVRESRGPNDAQLLQEVEALLSQLEPILRELKRQPRSKIVAAIRPLAPWATRKALEAAAGTGPAGAAHILVGARYHLAPGTVRNRISRTKKGA